MKDFLGRSPFVFLSALGLLSFTKSIISWQEDLQVLVDVYSATSHFMWRLLFGWLEDLFVLDVPPWFKDYLLMSFIFFGCLIRLHKTEIEDRHYKATKDELILPALAWPVVFVTLPIILIKNRSTPDFSADMKIVTILAESFVWALIFIAVNYALLFTG